MFFFRKGTHIHLWKQYFLISKKNSQVRQAWRYSINVCVKIQKLAFSLNWCAMVWNYLSCCIPLCFICLKHLELRLNNFDTIKTWKLDSISRWLLRSYFADISVRIDNFLAKMFLEKAGTNLIENLYPYWNLQEQYFNIISFSTSRGVVRRLAVI